MACLCLRFPNTPLDEVIKTMQIINSKVRMELNQDYFEAACGILIYIYPPEEGPNQIYNIHHFTTIERAVELLNHYYVKIPAKNPIKKDYKGKRPVIYTKRLF